MIDALLFLLHQQDPGKGCLARRALYRPPACGRLCIQFATAFHQSFTISDVAEGGTAHVSVCGERAERVARAWRSFQRARASPAPCFELSKAKWQLLLCKRTCLETNSQRRGCGKMRAGLSPSLLWLQGGLKNGKINTAN